MILCCTDLVNKEELEMKEVKGIAFDFGRVLAKWDKMPMFEKLASHSRLGAEEIKQKIIDSGLEQLHESGKLSSHVFYARVAREAQLVLPYDKFAKIWTGIFSPIKGIEDLIGRIDPDVRYVVLSNTGPLHWNVIKDISVMDTFFSEPERQVLSFEVGATKPSEKIFDEALKRLCMPSENVLFIDDIEVYTNAAQNLGFQTANFNAMTDSLSKLEAILDEHGTL